MARPGLRQHPKFRRLVHILQMPEAHVLGHLECLWSPAYENGDDMIGDAVDVEIAAGWVGEAGTLAAALASCGGECRSGFIEMRGATFHIHDLLDHAPEYVKDRLRKVTERKRTKADASKDCPQSSRTTSDASRTVPDESRTTSDASGTPRAAQPRAGGEEGETSSSATAAPTTDIPKKKRPTMLADDAEWLATIKAEQAYQGIDVHRELSKCRAYFSTKGITVSRQRFLNWLNRADRQLAGGNARPRGPIRVEMREGRLVSVCDGHVIPD